MAVRSFCSVLSELFISSWQGWSSIILTSVACLFLCPVGRRRCPETPSPFSSNRSSTTCMHQLLMIVRQDFQVKAHEILKVATSLLCWRNCAVHQVLEAGTWSSQFTSPLSTLRCHPQAFGYILHRSYGGSSAGRVAH